MSAFPEMSLAALLLALNITLVGAVLGLCVYASFRLGRSAHPRFRYLSAVSASFLSILLPLCIAVDFSKVLKTEHVLFADKAEHVSLTQSAEQWPAKVESLDALPADEAASVRAQSTAVAPAHYFPALVIRPGLSMGLLALWGSVSVVLLGREILGYVRLVKRRREWRLADAETRSRLESNAPYVPIYLSETDGPFAAGILWQAIVFPARLVEALPAEATRSIMLHELNHVRWHDPALNVLMRLMRSVFWFSPALWQLEHAARLEREVAADFAALISRRDDPELKTAAGDYAKTLVQVARWSAASIPERGLGFAATEAGNHAGLENRVRRLFRLSEKYAPLRLACAVSVLLSGIFGAYVLARVSQSLPVTLDTDSSSDEIVRLERAKVFGFNDTDFSPQASAIEAYKVLPTHRGQAQSPREPEASHNARSFVKTVINKEGALSNEPLQLSEENSLESSYAKTDWANLMAEQWGLMRRYGVTVSYMEELAAAGYRNLPVDALIEMKKFAVSAAFIKEMASFGYGNLSSEDLISFRRHGVSASYINEMRAAGYGNLSTPMIIDFRREALSTVYISEMRASIMGDISARQMVHLRRGGVTSGWIREISALGFRNLTANQLVAMRFQGVSVSFIQKMRERGYQNASIDELISLRTRGAG